MNFDSYKKGAHSLCLSFAKTIEHVEALGASLHVGEEQIAGLEKAESTQRRLFLSESIISS